jgi:hypothetical protein
MKLAKGGITPEEGLPSAGMFKATGQVDFSTSSGASIHTDPAMTDVIPVQGMKSAPHLDFAGTHPEAESRMPTFHAAASPMSPPRATPSPEAARHGRHDPGAHGRPAWSARS